MDPFCPSGWKANQKQLANWSDSDTSSSSGGESEEDGDFIDAKIEYYKLLQIKKVYKVILEEEELIL